MYTPPLPLQNPQTSSKWPSIESRSTGYWLNAPFFLNSPLWIRAFEKARCTRVFLNVDLAHLQNASENNVFKSFVDNRWQQARNLKIVCFFVLLFLEPYKPELITSCNKCRGAGFKTALHVYLERQVRNHMRREGHKSQILFVDIINHCWQYI